MSYFYDHMAYQNNRWYVYLLMPSKQELMDSLEYTNAIFKTHQPLCIYLENAKDQKPDGGHSYRVVTMRHQIDSNGAMFVSNAWNIRQQPCKASAAHAALDTIGLRYATQYDFDKFCYDNPDSRYPFDWNAEVYKAFIASTRATSISQ